MTAVAVQFGCGCFSSASFIQYKCEGGGGSTGVLSSVGSDPKDKTTVAVKFGYGCFPSVTVYTVFPMISVVGLRLMVCYPSRWLSLGVSHGKHRMKHLAPSGIYPGRLLWAPTSPEVGLGVWHLPAL